MSSNDFCSLAQVEKFSNKMSLIVLLTLQYIYWIDAGVIEKLSTDILNIAIGDYLPDSDVVSLRTVNSRLLDDLHPQYTKRLSYHIA